MSNGDKIHALVDVYSWGFGWSYLFVLVIDWALILLIMRFEPLGWGYLPPTHIRFLPGLDRQRRNYNMESRDFYAGFIYGPFALGITFACCTRMMDDFEPSGEFYTQRWWQWACLAAAIVVTIVTEYLGPLAGGNYTRKQNLMPSRLAHTAAFTAMVFFFLTMAFPVFVTLSPVWALLLMLISLGVWIRIIQLQKKWGPSETHYVH